MNTQVFDGRPDSNENRPDREIQVYDFLDQIKINYKRIDHEPVATMDACDNRGEILNIKISKNVFLCNTQKTKFYLLVMPGQKRYYTKVFSKLIGSSRLSFAPEELMIKYLNTPAGSASILGLINDKENNVELYIDSEILKNEYFGCHPCNNTSTLKFKMEDLLNKILPATNHKFTPVDLPWEV